MSQHMNGYAGYTVDEGLRGYILRVYNYMCAGLAISAISAFLTLYIEPLFNLMFYLSPRQGVTLTGFGVAIAFAPLIIGFYFFGKQNSLRLEQSRNLFWVYSALNGMSLSALGIAYTGESLATVFCLCAALFGAMSIYGHTTKKDLTELGSFLTMGLVGILLASLVNIVLGSSAIHFVSSVIGVLVFTGLIAYDTQKIKSYYYASDSDADHGKLALVGAFILYLDVVNLFLFMLRLFGVKRRGD